MNGRANLRRWGIRIIPAKHLGHWAVTIHGRYYSSHVCRDYARQSARLLAAVCERGGKVAQDVEALRGGAA